MWSILLFIAFAAAGLLIYWPALQGPLLGDDHVYLTWNKFVRGPLSFETLAAMWNPWGPATLEIANYAPVHLMLHGLEWQLFGQNLVADHVVNVLLHALNSTLLVALLLSWGGPRLGALLGGIFFLVHPANVEAVAWISQLKTTAALALSLGALLAFQKRPGLSTLLFALALLTKMTAAFALPAAAVLAWLRSDGASSVRRWGWLAGWVLVFAVCTIPQFASFERMGWVYNRFESDCFLQLRSMAAIGMRYLVMAVTGYGVSAMQEPEPVSSWLDPSWLMAIPTGILLIWRIVYCLRHRRLEAGFWLAAAAGFVPVSQLFPFVYPMADRYLYLILPGLIGGTLLLISKVRPRSRKWVSYGSVAAIGLVLFLFAVESAGRARLWRSELSLFRDSSLHYPDGISAKVLRARDAAAEGDAEATARALHAMAARGHDNFKGLMLSGSLDPVLNTPPVLEALQEIAGNSIRKVRARSNLTQKELRLISDAHRLRNEYSEAAQALEQALQVSGSLDETLRAELMGVQHILQGGGIGAYGVSPTVGAIWLIVSKDEAEQELAFLIYLEGEEGWLHRQAKSSWDPFQHPMTLEFLIGDVRVYVEYWDDPAKVRIFGRDLELSDSNLILVRNATGSDPEVVGLGRSQLRFPLDVNPALRTLNDSPSTREAVLGSD